MPKKNGFHLIEILISFAIIAIIATLSFPLYSEYIVQERRMEAVSLLSKLAVAMEQYQLENNSYKNATLEKLHLSEFIAKDNYQIIIQSANDDDYLLIAKPLNHQDAKETRCRSLTLRANGEKGITGDGNVDECW